MSSPKIRQLLFFQLILVLIATSVACNSKTDETETDIVVTYSTVAVKNFSLKSNDSVMSHLDSVFFSIDLNTGVIFNADSLPKGTNLSRVVPSITFANNMSEAEIEFRKDNLTDTTVNYLTNPEDSIDFTYPVKLNVTAADGQNKFTYQIKVNVHQQDPDSLIWNKLEYSSLPSRYPSPVAQKTIRSDETIYTIVEENNGEYTLSTTTDINAGNWDKTPFSAGFNPDVKSLSSSNKAFYLLDKSGNLYTSSDMKAWAACGQTWSAIIGGFNDNVLGLKKTGSTYYHTQYPASEGYVEKEIEAGFPVEGFSTLGLISSEWASQPVGILAGGVTSKGTPTSTVWGFDSRNWTILNSDVLPSAVSPMLARYVVYRKTASLFVKREFDVWLFFGGVLDSGEMNREVYMSYDNGVTWHEAPETMQLSDKLPELAGGDVIVAGYPLSADLSEAWTPTPDTKTRSGYTIDGYDITWMCPYMYVFGGYLGGDNKKLNTDIYRGVLERLRFTPNI